MIVGMLLAGGLIAVMVCGTLLVPRMIRGFFYPTAPPMPPVVGNPISVVLAELETVMKEKAPKVLDEMQPGLSSDEIAKIEAKAGIQLSAEIRALYQWRNGCRTADPRIVGPVPGHRFLPLDEALNLSTIISNQVGSATVVQRAAVGIFTGHRKSWIPLFEDGAGDGYFFDPTRKASEGAIFFSFAEDSTYVFFPSLANLLAGVVKGYTSGAFSWKEGPPGPGLEEDFERSRAIWNEFGASNVR